MTFLLKNNNYLQKFDKKFAPSHIESGKTLCDGGNRSDGDVDDLADEGWVEWA